MSINVHILFFYDHRIVSNITNVFSDRGTFSFFPKFYPIYRIKSIVLLANPIHKEANSFYYFYYY